MLIQFHLRSNFQKYVSTRTYLYLFVYFICGGKVDASERLKYENPFKDNDIQWKQKLNAFIHQYEKYCTNEDTTVNILETKQNNTNLKLNEIPYFSPCGLSDRDIFNIYKFLEFEDSTGKPKRFANFIGCDLNPLLDDGRVSCAATIKGKCVMRLENNRVIALPGTKILSNKYQESSNTSWTICDGKDWKSLNKNDSEDAIRRRRMLEYDSEHWVPSPITGGAECGLRTEPGGEGGPQINNGKNAKLGEFPWQAAIYNNSIDFPICGATIISQRFLISAAHCFNHNPKNYGDYTIIVGILESNRSIHNGKESQIHKIQELFTRGYIRNKNFFNHHFHNDVVIIMTKTDINFDANVSPLCLIDCYHPKIAEGSRLIVSGWGLTENDIRSNQLKYVEVHYQSYDECTKKASIFFSHFLTPDKMCAVSSQPNSGITVNSADTGAGFAAKHDQEERFYLIGVAGMISTNDTNQPSAVGAFVPHFLHWILEIIEQNM